jgi:antitoxin CptB
MLPQAITAPVVLLQVGQTRARLDRRIWCGHHTGLHDIDETMMPMNELEIRRKKALFRAQRRGFKELDLIFAAFADAHLHSMDRVALERFEALLSVPDWQIFGWIMGHEAVPTAYDDDVFARLCCYRANLKL